MKVRGALFAAGVLLLLLLTAVVPRAVAQTPDPISTPPPQLTEEPRQETLEARVLTATPPNPCGGGIEASGFEQQCQRLELLVTEGSIKGQRIAIEEGQLPVANRAGIYYKPGDRVLVDWISGGDQGSAFYITDFIRTDGLLVLAAVYVVLAVIFGGLKGLSSLLGLTISFAIIFFFVLPRIVAGDDPVFISVLGALAIMLATLYLSHGFSLKTTAALMGTSISLVLTGLLAWVAVEIVRLSGFGSEEAMYIQIAQGGAINLRGILLGGIIIGALGVLDDITISQSAAVFEMKRIDPALGWRRLFSHAVSIGRDHIAATTNTLVLAYAGASLPLLILFVTGTDPWTRVVNLEIVAEEVVRTLVGTIGLMASVPVTTALAAWLATKRPPPPLPEGHTGHAHGHHH
ncbi:MAG: YibE/F family protein [Chloroflexia bacterium]